jgi:hypothetical protein
MASTEDFDDDDIEIVAEEGVELGFIEPFKGGEDWNIWDSGKVGGRAAFLNPNLRDPLTCDHCDKTLTFLLQIYAPIDDMPEIA